MKLENPDFQPAFPAAHNPVLRPPMGRTGRVWIEHEEAAETVDLANTGYALMLRLLAHSYLVSRPLPGKGVGRGSVDGSDARGDFARRARDAFARRSRKPRLQRGHVVHCAARRGLLAAGASTRRFFAERLAEMAAAADKLAENGDPHVKNAARIIHGLSERAERGFAAAASTPPPASPTVEPSPGLAAARAPNPDPDRRCGKRSKVAT